MDSDLDLRPLLNSYSGRGSKPHPPALLLKLTLFEHQRGRYQPQQWRQDLRENRAVQWLCRGLQVSKSSLYEFRDRVEPFLPDFHAQVVRTAIAERHTEAKTGALDGTYVAAHSSRHRLLSLETVEQRLEQLRQIEASEPAVAVVPPPSGAAHDTAAAGAVLAPPDGAFPVESSAEPPCACEPSAATARPAWMSSTPRGRKRQERRLRQAAEVLRQRHAANDCRRKDKRQQARRIRVSLGDPQAAPGRDKHDVFRPLYNIQVVTDQTTDLILAYEVNTKISDNGQMVSMLDRTRAVIDRELEKLLVDAGYLSGPELAICRSRGVEVLGPWQKNSYSDARAQAAGPRNMLPKDQFVWEASLESYRCPQGNLLTYAGKLKKQKANGEYRPLLLYQARPEDCVSCPQRARCTSRGARTVRRQPDEELIEELNQRMQTPEAKRLYKQRCCTVERRFADLKTHRNFQRLSGQGPNRARAQTGLTVLTHNLVTLDALRAAKSHPPPAEILTKTAD